MNSVFTIDNLIKVIKKNCVEDMSAYTNDFERDIVRFYRYGNICLHFATEWSVKNEYHMMVNGGKYPDIDLTYEQFKELFFIKVNDDEYFERMGINSKHYFLNAVLQSRQQSP